MNLSEQITNKALGCMLGLAIGDAIGSTLEFIERDTVPPLDGMIGGGIFNLRPGEWTDDTSMALCLADSLIHASKFDAYDLMRRFLCWYRYGEYSPTGECFDIGSITREALTYFEETGNFLLTSSYYDSAGNGSIMRLAPVAIRFHSYRDDALTVATAQSKVTHTNIECVECCQLLAFILVELLNGTLFSIVLQNCNTLTFSSPKVQNLVQGEWKTKSRSEIRSTGYVIHTLEAALWSVYATSNFKEAILLAVNLGGDSDTVGAVTGQIAGALYGATAIPQEWKERLAWKNKIIEIVHQLLGKQMMSIIHKDISQTGNL